QGAVYHMMAKIQELTAFLPDYSFKNGSGAVAGTSFSGIIGGGIMLGLACLAGYMISHAKKKRNARMNDF
ncbi:MAG: PDGLE domain-containing protein, partial [Bacillota bacterium]